MSKLCALPFTHLATHPTGHTSLCCLSDHTRCASHAKIGKRTLSLNDTPIHTMLNSDPYRQARLDMLAGKEPDVCKRCFDEERKGIKSKRLVENERYLNSSLDAIGSVAENGTIKNLDLQFVELRLGNICNLKCRTCNPVSSSKWIKEHTEMRKEMPFLTNYTDVETGIWFERDEFWQELLNASPNLKKIYINGGEPTLVEKHFTFLQRLIDLDRASSVELWYNINLTTLPAELVEMWRKFKSITVTVSIDDLGPRNEYIRTGSDWREILDNLNKLTNTSGIEIDICQTVSMYNAFYLDEFYKFFKDYRIHHNWCYDPVFLSPWHLPDNVKELIIEKCASMPEYERNNITQTLQRPRSIENYSQFIQYNKRLDLNRSTKFAEIFPELVKLIDYR